MFTLEVKLIIFRALLKIILQVFIVDDRVPLNARVHFNLACLILSLIYLLKYSHTHAQTRVIGVASVSHPSIRRWRVLTTRQVDFTLAVLLQGELEAAIGSHRAIQARWDSGVDSQDTRLLVVTIGDP